MTEMRCARIKKEASTYKVRVFVQGAEYPDVCDVRGVGVELTTLYDDRYDRLFHSLEVVLPSHDRITFTLDMVMYDTDVMDFHSTEYISNGKKEVFRSKGCE